MGKLGKIITIFLVSGIVGLLQPQYTEICQAETSTEKAGLDYTFDEKTGTLTIYGKGMLGSKDKYNYSNYFQHELGFRDSLDKIRKVVIGDEITGIYEFGTEKIRDGAFAYSRFKGVTIPASVTALSDGMFRNCIKLEEVTFAKNSKCKQTMYSEDAGGTFEGCVKLKKLEFGEKFQWITPNAFRGCTALKQFTWESLFGGFKIPTGRIKNFFPGY